MDTLYLAGSYLVVKLPTLLIAGAMAILGIFIDGRRHHWPTTIVAVIAGCAMAALLVDPIQELLHLSDLWKNALAGLIGIGGRNLVITVSRIAKDPAYLVRIWRGDGGSGDE